MGSKLVFSIAESPAHPDLRSVYEKVCFNEERYPSTRKAIQGLKKNIPDVIVADFIYGYGSNYAGANVCNMDVFMRTMAKYNQDTPLILFAEKSEGKFIEKFADLFHVSAALPYPVDINELESILLTIKQQLT